MTDIELRIRIAQSLAEVPAAAWDACASGSDDANGRTAMASAVKLTSEDNLCSELLTRGKIDNPFITHAFLVIAGSIFFGRRADRLAAAPPAGRSVRWHSARCRALLREEPFPRRICLRPRLGRGLRARRRRLLPQAPGRGAVHPGDRPPPARSPWTAGASRPRRSGGRPRRDHHRQRPVLGARDLPHRAGMARARRARLPAA